jgi:hypothetical protein
VELAAVQQLVAAIGPIGAIAVIGAWWFVTHKEKRSDAATRLYLSQYRYQPK